MKLVSWNVENALRCLSELPAIVEDLGRPEVLCLQGRMYGVATFVQGRWKAEVAEWDREGRVVVVRKPGLAVVNVCAVNGTPSRGSTMPAAPPATATR